MSIYMIIPTDKNRHAVRPATWGFELHDGKISENINHTAVFQKYSDAEWFARIKSLDERGLVIRIPEELEGIDVKSLQYALTYAICMVRYGVQITPEILENATRLSAELHQAYLKGCDDERKRFESIMEENKNED